MFPRIAAVWLVAGALVLAVGGTAHAQDSSPDRPPYTSLINVDALVDSYARLLARKYNLNDEQGDFTEAFIRERADEFLGQHRDELFSLIDEMFAVRGGAEYSQQEMIAWGKRALPIYEEARTLIIDGNEEWRDILDEEQKKIHDQDLELMYESFAMSEEQLNLIVSGQMTVEEFRRGHPGRPSRARRPVERTEPAEPLEPVEPRVQDPRPVHKPRKVEPVKPKEDAAARARARLEELREKRRAQAGNRRRDVGHRSNPRNTRRTVSLKAGEQFESKWEQYVRQFIEKYSLNEAQAEKAEAILKSCQSRAQSYMTKRKPQLDVLNAQIEKINSAEEKAPDAARQIAKINERKDKILEHVDRIFEYSLKPRLEKLPTRAQRAAAGGDRDRPERKPTRRTQRPSPRKPTGSGDSGKD